jgi:hypothetical protein
VKEWWRQPTVGSRQSAVASRESSVDGHSRESESGVRVGSPSRKSESEVALGLTRLCPRLLLSTEESDCRFGLPIRTADSDYRL